MATQPMMTRLSEEVSDVDLDRWIGVHGPLEARHVLLMLFELCGSIDKGADHWFGSINGSLQVQAIVRRPQVGWQWRFAAAPQQTQTMTEREIVERLGVIAYFGLTGERLEFPLPEPGHLRSRIRHHRPDVQPALIDLVTQCLTGEGQRSLTLAGLSRITATMLGVRHRERSLWSRRSVLSLSAGALMTLVAYRAIAVGRVDVTDSTGLTGPEQTVSRIQLEAAESAAVTEEHTAAIQRYQEVHRIWGSRIDANDPRLAMNDAYQAWVRTLSGDRLTTEQILEKAPQELAATLDDGHPYVRMTRLALAETLDARNAGKDAASIRAQADADTRAVFDRLGVSQPSVDPYPVPPGVIAHVASNAPEKEGFQRSGDDYWLPLTANQHLMSARNGWTLHVVSSGACRVSLAAGFEAKRFTVSTASRPDGPWTLTIDGVRPTSDVMVPFRKAVAFSLAARQMGQVDLVIDGATTTLSLDPASPSELPAGIRFNDASACSLVWLEIPYPPAHTFRAQ